MSTYLYDRSSLSIPQVVQHEVIRQKASGAMQQRIIQTGLLELGRLPRNTTSGGQETTYKAKTEIFEKSEVAAVDEGRTPAQELNSVIGKRR